MEGDRRPLRDLWGQYLKQLGKICDGCGEADVVYRGSEEPDPASLTIAQALVWKSIPVTGAICDRCFANRLAKAEEDWPA